MGEISTEGLSTACPEDLEVCLQPMLSSIDHVTELAQEPTLWWYHRCEDIDILGDGKGPFAVEQY